MSDITRIPRLGAKGLPATIEGEADPDFRPDDKVLVFDCEKKVYRRVRKDWYRVLTESELLSP